MSRYLLPPLTWVKPASAHWDNQQRRKDQKTIILKPYKATILSIRLWWFLQQLEMHYHTPPFFISLERLVSQQPFWFDNSLSRAAQLSLAAAPWQNRFMFYLRWAHGPTEDTEPRRQPWALDSTDPEELRAGPPHLLGRFTWTSMHSADSFIWSDWQQRSTSNSSQSQAILKMYNARFLRKVDYETS